MPTADRATTWTDLMRGVVGAAILGLPLVYTQEVWVLGATLPPRPTARVQTNKES